MPFWPWYMAICVALIWRYRAGAVFAPVAILCGLLAMRAVVLLPDAARELMAFIPWLCVAIYLMYKGAWVPGALCLLSGATYPTLLVVGLHIEYMGLVPIIADAFLLAAMAASGLGMAQRFNSGDNCARMVGNGESFALGMATNKTIFVKPDRREAGR